MQTATNPFGFLPKGFPPIIQNLPFHFTTITAHENTVEKASTFTICFVANHTLNTLGKVSILSPSILQGPLPCIHMPSVKIPFSTFKLTMLSQTLIPLSSPIFLSLQESLEALVYLIPKKGDPFNPASYCSITFTCIKSPK